jgi:hypothetical protein
MESYRCALETAMSARWLKKTGTCQRYSDLMTMRRDPHCRNGVIWPASSAETSCQSEAFKQARSDVPPVNNADGNINQVIKR